MLDAMAFSTAACASMNAREKAFVLVMCLALLVMTSNYALMVTFFPIYAAEQGMSNYLISTIFAAFDVGKLATSIFAGKLASRFGRWPVLVWGAAQISVVGIAIGLTPDVAGDDINLMAFLFTVARLAQGSGVALSQLSIFAVLSDEFPANRGLVVGSATSMIALGYFVGAPVGGALFTVFGFRTPFISLSLLVALCIPAMAALQPARRSAESSVKNLTAADSAAEAREADATTATSSSHPGTTELALAGKPSDTRAPPSGSLPAATAGHEHAPTSDALGWLLRARHLPADAWIVATMALVYTSKWAWWDIYFTSWLVDEFDASIPSASLHIAVIAGTFGTLAPLSGAVGDRLGNRRTTLIAGAMGMLAVVYLSMGPWQPGAWGWSIGTRRAMLYVYMVTDALMCCLVEPQLMPQMLSTAEAKAGETDEHQTNFVTSVGQTAMNLGSVVGPCALAS